MRRALLLPLLLAPLLLTPPTDAAPRGPTPTISCLPPNMIFVPPGRLLMGSADGEPDERPVHAVTLRGFFLDREEVTVMAYRACVTAKQCERAHGSTGGANLPMVWVSWRDAAAYCRFVGKRLPTEAEWERAARGDDGRTYPWGNDVDCDKANFGSWHGEGRCEQNPGAPEPVGLRSGGASPFGALGMAGNVWEWVADRYDANYYRASPKANPTGPAKGPAQGEVRRVVRGDGCCSMFGLPRASNRNAWPEDYADDDLGFRCAMDVSGVAATK